MAASAAVASQCGAVAELRADGILESSGWRLPEEAGPTGFGLYDVRGSGRASACAKGWPGSRNGECMKPAGRM